MSLEKFKNPNGTYNGLKALAEISGLSEKEVEWTWKRMLHLRKVEGKTSKEAKKMINEEAKSKPWESSNG